MSETPSDVEMTTVCPSCGGASLYVPDAIDCDVCHGEGKVAPYPIPTVRPPAGARPGGEGTPTLGELFDRLLSHGVANVVITYEDEIAMRALLAYDPPRPAAVSAPAGEATDDVSAAHSHLLDLVLSRKYSGASLQKAIRDLIAAAERRARSPAPASGAPDEDGKSSGIPADRFRAVMLKAVEDLGFHGLHPTDEAIASLASVIANASRLGWEVDRANYESRLAASERAGEALRELLDEWVSIHEDNPCKLDHHGYCQSHYLERDCIVPRTRAALTPTASAPSPDRED